MIYLNLEEQLVTPDKAMAIAIARVQQLDQAITILGDDTRLGVLLVAGRRHWLTVQEVLQRHLTDPDSCSSPVFCAFKQIATTHDPSEDATGEVLCALLGLTTAAELLAFVMSAGTGRGGDQHG